VETIRYYEREGLLPVPARTGGNYRLYGTQHVERLRFIRNCRSLDMTHDEIRTLLAFRDGAMRAESCRPEQVAARWIAHIMETEQVTPQSARALVRADLLLMAHIDISASAVDSHWRAPSVQITAKSIRVRSSAAGALVLNRRTLYGTERAEDTAVTGLRAQHCPAVRAFVEK